MGGLRRRLERLEAPRAKDGGSLLAGALTLLSDEDLEALAGVLERDGAGAPDEALDLERLRAREGREGRRALEALEGALETARKGGRGWGT